MFDKIKPAGGGFASRTLTVALIVSIAVHAAMFGAGEIFAGGSDMDEMRHSGDVIQLAEFEVKPSQPKALTPDQKTKAPETDAANTKLDGKPDSVEKKPKPAKKPKPKVKVPDNKGAVVVQVGADGGVGEPDGGPGDNPDGGEADDPDAPPPAASADLGPYAPGDARIIAILHADRIRQSPMRQGAEDLLDALPDTQMILEGTGLRAFDDFDTILVATSDPADISQTFLAGRGTGGADKLMKSLSGADGKRVTWTRMAGRAVGKRPKAPKWDPRLYVVAGPKWMVFGRPEQLGALGETETGTGAGTGAGTGSEDGGSDGGVPGDGGASSEPVPPAWAKRLGQIRTVAGEDVDGPAMVLSVADLRGAMRIPKSVTAPIPKQAIFAVRLEPESAMCWGTIVFDTPAIADEFAQQWQHWRAMAAADKLMSLLGIPALMDKVELTRDDKRVLLRTRLTATQVGSLLGFVAIQVRQRAGERIKP